jgi:putative transposase
LWHFISSGQGYAVTFNLRHNRTGHLFQNRYKSIVCDVEEYLLELVRYIHLNPLRAGLVSTLDDLDSYPWCGHSVLMKRNELPGQETAGILSRFAKSVSAAVKRYHLAGEGDCINNADLTPQTHLSHQSL